MMREKLTRWFPWALLLICAVTYAGLLNNEFMIDDSAFYQGKTFDSHFKRPSDYLAPEGIRHFYPLYLYLNITKHRLFPDNPPAHHLINLGLYFVVCLLFYNVIYRLSGDYPTAVMASIFFCIHPINADNISHTDITNSLLSGALMAATFFCLLRYVNDRSKRSLYWLGVFLYSVAVCNGEPALLFPLYAFLLLFVAKNQNLRDSLKLAAPFFLIAAAVFIIWMNFYGPSNEAAKGLRTLNVNGIEFLASVFYAILWYTKNIIYPGPIFLIHNFTPVKGGAALLLFILLCAGSGLVIFLIRRWGRTMKSFALLWFCAGFIFVLPASLAHPSMGFVLEPYWLFFPTMGGVLLLSLFFVELRRQIDRRLYIILLVAIIALFFVRTQEKNYIANNEALYAYHWLKASPGNLIAGLILSSYYEREDVDIDPELIPEMTRMVEIFYRTGTYDRAEKLNEKLIKVMRQRGAPP